MKTKQPAVKNKKKDKAIIEILEELRKESDERYHRANDFSPFPTGAQRKIVYALPSFDNPLTTHTIKTKDTNKSKE